MLVSQLVLSHAMKTTTKPSDWDAGDGSVVHALHGFVYESVDVFPIYFVYDNTNVRYEWYGVKKARSNCPCLKGLPEGFGGHVVDANEVTKLRKTVDVSCRQNEQLQKEPNLLRANVRDDAFITTYKISILEDRVGAIENRDRRPAEAVKSEIRSITAGVRNRKRISRRSGCC